MITAPFAAYGANDRKEAYRLYFDDAIFTTDDPRELEHWKESIVRAGGTYVAISWAETPREERMPW